MLSEQNEQVNVRRLNDGRTQPGVCESLKGSLLQIRLREAPRDGWFDKGDLVEIDAARSLYLGVIVSKDGSHILIAAEHALDRESLAAIQEVWHRPDDV